MFGTLRKKNNKWVITHVNSRFGDDSNDITYSNFVCPLPLPDGVFIEDVFFEGNYVEFELTGKSNEYAKIINIKKNKHRIIHRNSDGCPFYLQENGLYQASDEHGTETLKEEDSVEFFHSRKTLEDAANSYAAYAAINGVDAKLVRRDFKAGVVWERRRVDFEGMIVSHKEWDQIQKKLNLLEAFLNLEKAQKELYKVGNPCRICGGSDCDSDSHK